MFLVQREFSFTEPDHLTRIHLLLALEDLGFEVSETGLVLSFATFNKKPEPADHES